MKQNLWKGVHFRSPGRDRIGILHRVVEEKLAPMGFNAMVLEVNYGFEWQSHPELRTGDEITREQAMELSKVCKSHGIRLIPQFNCIGHQSWDKATFQLLTHYPEFDETPGTYPNNEGIYCRSWCSRHPDVNQVIFALMVELVDAFDADAFHIGADETFVIASEHCPRCKGADPAIVYAEAINDYHRFLVGEKGLEMMMWGDRLLDAKEMGYDEMEGSKNGTAPAVDLIPKDIVICDWHYGIRGNYPSVDYLQEKGFRVWPASWKGPLAPELLLNYSLKHDHGKMIGHLCTTWYDPYEMSLVLLGEATTGETELGTHRTAQAMRMVSERIASS